MGYSFFLFSKLHDAIIGVSDEPYDYQYEDLFLMYHRYSMSKYNNPNVGEYECMVQYLNFIKSDESKEELNNSQIKYQS